MHRITVSGDSGSRTAIRGGPGCATMPGWAALRDGWIESAALRDVPAACRAWACRFMLADLAQRYPADELEHIADALDQAL